MTDNIGEGYPGQQELSDDTSAFNSICFIVSQMLGRISTMKVVQVMKVTNDGAISPVGFVDVMPLVNQIDQDGFATPHGTISNLPYFRLQGGSNAVIIDPKVGNIGIAVFADRDISAVKVNKAQSIPGSYRRFAEADGVYLGGILNGTPTQYFAFTETGLKIADKNGNAIEFKAGGIFVTGNLVVNNNLQLGGSIENVAGTGVYASDIKTTGNVVAGSGTGDQVGLQTHNHTSAASGSPTSAPTPGT